jgi:hypothetical protein
MIRIDYPQHDFRFKEEKGKESIFDEVRKQWVRLTPEEWVRQNFLQYIIQTKKYPPSLIAVEKEIKLGELKKRCDIVVYKNNRPWLIVECKEMNIPVNNAVATQILNYNQKLDVDYLIITNGRITFGLKTQNRQQIFELPEYTLNSYEL